MKGLLRALKAIRFLTRNDAMVWDVDVEYDGKFDDRDVTGSGMFSNTKYVIEGWSTRFAEHITQLSGLHGVIVTFWKSTVHDPRGWEEIGTFKDPDGDLLQLAAVSKERLSVRSVPGLVEALEAKVGAVVINGSGVRL